MAYLRVLGFLVGLLLLAACTMQSMKSDQFRSGPEVIDISNFA